jgi:phosphoserine phosphatase RsbU/P
MDYPSLSTISNPLLSTIESVPITILLIDDQKIIAEAIQLMINDQTDMTLHYCSDPTEALEVVKSIKPTVILQDLVMPNFDGLVLVKYFQSQSTTKDIPVIVLSGKEDPYVKAQAFALGAHDYIVKLPDKVELIARIRYHSNSYIRLLERNEAFRRLEESQNALHAELAEAAAYVRSLLPPPLHGRIETDWRFIPSTQLGGDAFGYHWLDDDHFAMYLLDVCGHGIGAALLSISVINLLRSQTLPKADFHDPKSVLQELNLAFQMENHNNMFFTIWYGVFKKKTKEIIYATGGHPPAILITGKSRETSQLHQLKTIGIVIGAIPEANFSNASCQVEEYNQFYLFSDGVYEVTQDNGTMLDYQDFVDLIAKMERQGKIPLDEMVHLMQNLQHKPLFVDDFSLLQITFN